MINSTLEFNEKVNIYYNEFVTGVRYTKEDLVQMNAFVLYEKIYNIKLEENITSQDKVDTVKTEFIDIYYE